VLLNHSEDHRDDSTQPDAVRTPGEKVGRFIGWFLGTATGATVGISMGWFICWLLGLSRGWSAISGVLGTALTAIGASDEFYPERATDSLRNRARDAMLHAVTGSFHCGCYARLVCWLFRLEPEFAATLSAGTGAMFGLFIGWVGFFQCNYGPRDPLQELLRTRLRDKCRQEGRLIVTSVAFSSLLGVTAWYVTGLSPAFGLGFGTVVGLCSALDRLNTTTERVPLGKALRNQPDTSAFDLFVKKAVDAASTLATQCGHPAMGSEHLLMALLTIVPDNEGRSYTRGTLEQVGAAVDRLESALQDLIENRMLAVSAPRVLLEGRRVIGHAQEAMAWCGENRVGLDHVLLGMFQDRETTASQLLDALGVDPAKVCELVLTAGNHNFGQWVLDHPSVAIKPQLRLHTEA